MKMKVEQNKYKKTKKNIPEIHSSPEHPLNPEKKVK